MSMDRPEYFRLGLIGWPVAHSLSPRIHQAAFQATGIQGEYTLYPVNPDTRERELQSLLDRLRRREINGLNVTVPHKKHLAKMVDEVTPEAQAIGAVNTLYINDGKLIGDNSDAPGFLNHLARLRLVPPHRKLSWVILGAGGSARAVAYALVRQGHSVTIAARRGEQAQQLADDLNLASGVLARLAWIALDYERISSQVRPDWLVNTTPAGMNPLIEQSPWPDEIPLPKACRVYDLIYNPPHTQFLNQARQQGLTATNGLGMLVEQAAISFTIWTGVPPPLESLYQAVGLTLPVSAD
jgi:shikimate dehydrogenase